MSELVGPAGTWPTLQVFACISTVSQRPHVICNSYKILRPHLWEYAFTPYLYGYSKPAWRPEPGSSRTGGGSNQVQWFILVTMWIRRVTCPNSGDRRLPEAGASLWRYWFQFSVRLDPIIFCLYSPMFLLVRVNKISVSTSLMPRHQLISFGRVMATPRKGLMEILQTTQI